MRYLVFFVAVLVLANGWLLGEGTPAASAAAGSSKASSKAKSGKKRTKRSKRGRKSASWRRGQQKMDSARAREIQEALIREDYLQGESTGIWDQKSQKAMEKFQADNGWQSKTVPDARALIKLGLGPNHDHLLNPDSAMTSPIETPSAVAHPELTPSAVTSGSESTSNQPQN